MRFWIAKLGGKRVWGISKQTGKIARGRRWSAIVLTAVAAGLLAMSIAWAQSPAGASGAALTVDGEEIAEAELRLHMERNRALVADEYRRQYGAETDEDFWTRRYGDGTPDERLRAVAGEHAARTKVEQMIACESGVLNDIGYDAFMRALETENERRAEASASKQIVYGPIRFEPNVFYGYYMSGIRNAAIRALVDSGELRGTENEARSEYEAMVERRLEAAHIEWKR